MYIYVYIYIYMYGYVYYVDISLDEGFCVTEAMTKALRTGAVPATGDLQATICHHPLFMELQGTRFYTTPIPKLLSR